MDKIGILGFILKCMGLVTWIVTLDISYSYGKTELFWASSWKLMALMILGYLFIVSGAYIDPS